MEYTHVNAQFQVISLNIPTGFVHVSKSEIQGLFKAMYK